jgi:hypothetical protein
VLPPNVLGTHVDDALESEARTDGRRRNTVLARAGLRDDAPFAEARREEDLAERVVDLVCARVIQVLALEDDAAADRREPPRLVERRRAADIVRSEAVELRAERRVLCSPRPIRARARRAQG